LASLLSAATVGRTIAGLHAVNEVLMRRGRCAAFEARDPPPRLSRVGSRARRQGGTRA
jgi:hypothetical protein